MIAGGDPDAVYAYYCLHRLRLLPSAFMSLDRQEKAFIIACVDVKLQRERDAEKRRKARRKS